VRWIAARRESGRWRHGDRADLAFGSLCAHRALEGAALGALYTTSAAIGAVGVIVVAGHAALETVAVGGLYSTRRLLAVAAITIVQGGYLAGALVGVGGAGAVPESVRAVIVGLLAGVLVLEGVSRLRRASRHVLESGAAVTAR
jgi:zinc transporter ZupT